MADSIACKVFNMTGYDVVMGSSKGGSDGDYWADVAKNGTPIPQEGIEIGKLRKADLKDPKQAGLTDHYGWLDFVEKHGGQETPYQLFLRDTPGRGKTPAGVLQAALGLYDKDSHPGNPMPRGADARMGVVYVKNRQDGPILFFLGDFGEGHGSQTTWPPGQKP